MTTQEALKGISNYPIPQRTYNEIAVARRLDLSQEATPEIIFSSEYKLVKSDLLKWLASAPNISEGGVSFSFSEAEKTRLENQSKNIISEIGTPLVSRYGYKGENL